MNNAGLQRMMGAFALVLLVSATLAIGGANDAEAQGPPWVEVRTPVSFVVQGPAWVEITDLGCSDDTFSIALNGTFVGNSFGGLGSCDRSTDDPDVAFASSDWASANGCVAAGAITVTLTGTSADGDLENDSAYRVIPGDPRCDFLRQFGDAIISYAPLCINSDEAQTDDVIQHLQTGSAVPKPGPHYALLVDGEGCGYYCDDGFDLNCDNKIGDFCPVELNAQVVKNVNPCLQASVPSVPAAATAAAAPQAIAVTPTSTLAHTGVEDALALLGTTVIGLGATAMALRAHVRRRED